MSQNTTDMIADIQSRISGIEELLKDSSSMQIKLDELYELTNCILDMQYKMRTSINLINKSNINNYGGNPSGNIAAFPRNAKEWIRTEIDKDLDVVLSWFEKYDNFDEISTDINNVRNKMGNKPGVNKKYAQMLWTFILKNEKIRHEVGNWYGEIKKEYEANNA